MVTWRNFSGAPALLLPRSLLAQWHGIYLPGSEAPRELNLEYPVTDYDRACRAAWPGVGLVPVGTEHGLALYSEDDTYAWLPEHQIVASGSWAPDSAALEAAEWGDPIEWDAGSELVLLNSAANAAEELHEEDMLCIDLSAGHYRIEFAFIKANHWGWFHRFTAMAPPSGAQPPARADRQQRR